MLIITGLQNCVFTATQFSTLLTEYTNNISSMKKVQKKFADALKNSFSKTSDCLIEGVFI